MDSESPKRRIGQETAGRRLSLNVASTPRERTSPFNVALRVAPNDEYHPRYCIEIQSLLSSTEVLRSNIIRADISIAMPVQDFAWGLYESPNRQLG